MRKKFGTSLLGFIATAISDINYYCEVKIEQNAGFREKLRSFLELPESHHSGSCEPSLAREPSVARPWCTQTSLIARSQSIETVYTRAVQPF